MLITVVSFAPPEKLAVYQKQRKWLFLMLSDPERTVYRQFGLGGLSWLQMLGPATIKVYLGAILRGRRFQYYGKDDYEQGGGDFMLDRQGNVLYAHRSKSPADRPAAQALLKVIDAR